MRRREFLSNASGLSLGLLAGTAIGETPASMLQRAAPRAGITLPAIGMGTWRTFDVPPNDPSISNLREVLSRFCAAGGQVVDTSPMYGRAEAMLGSLARQLALADQLFFATKVWTEGREAGRRQMDTSAKLLHRQVIDLMQVHNLLDLQTQLAELRQRQEQGRIRFSGITHYQAGAHADLVRVLRSEPLDFVQVNYSVRHREAETTVFPVAQELGVAVIVNRPFDGGALFRAVGERPLPAWAAEYGAQSWSELALKFVLGHEAVTVAIPATSNPDHMTENLRAGTGEPVTGQRREQLAQRLIEALES
ncbi:MAG: aldo/keto reductase [Pseudomonadota bacterium]